MPNKNNKVTIRDIAQACGVTIATVSRAINNKPGMRDEVRRNILWYIENIGYRSNSLQNRFPAVAGKSKRVICIGNIYNLSFSGFRPMQTAITETVEALEKKDINTTVICGSLAESLWQCRQFAPDAVVIFGGSEIFEDQIKELQKAGIKVLSAFGNYDGELCPSIHSDYFKLGVMAGRKMQALNCKKTALFAPIGVHSHPVNFTSSLPPRFREIIEGLIRANPGFDPQNDVVSDNYSRAEEFFKMLKSGCYDSWICIGREIFDLFHSCCYELSIDPHRDLTLVPVLEKNGPFDQVTRYGRFFESGKRIAKQIIKLIENDNFEAIEYRIPYSWKDTEPFELPRGEPEIT